MEDENRKEELGNKQRNQRIEILKREHEETLTRFHDFKEAK